MTTFLKINQPFCILLWIAIAYNLLFPLPGLWHDILFYTGPVLLIGHFGEWIALKGRFAQLGHQSGRTFLMVMVFGFFWWLPVLLENSKEAEK